MLYLSLCVVFVPLCGSVPLAGWVQSPGYPRGYEPFSSLTWVRCAPPGHTLSLALTHLDLEDSYECENDALKVYADATRISTLCGTIPLQDLRSSVNPSLVSSPGGCLNVSFSSDYSNMERHSGFRAFYTIQDYNECDDPNIECSHFCYNFIGGYLCACPPGYVLNPDKHNCSVSCTEDLSGSLRGLVSPPGGAGSYAEEAHCSYSLAVEEGLQLVLQFTGDFDVEARPNGECIDAVRIETRSKTYGPFCGTVAPGLIDTGSSKVQILFNSDNGGANKGFTVAYKTKRMTCPVGVTPHSTVQPEHQEYVMGDTITVTCDQGTVVELPSGPGIKSNATYETRCQKNGMWKPVYQCGVVDCGRPSLPYAVKVEDLESTHYKSEIHFICSSKYYQLESDEVFTCEADGFWKSKTGQTNIPRCLPICGLTDNLIEASGRILGGKRAKVGQIPWQLLIKAPERGGASLINDRWAVTAAHVVDKHQSETITVYGGMIDGQDQNAVVMQTEKIIVHPNYGKDGDANREFNNDIALLKMSSTVELGPKLLPICLPESSEGAALEGKMGTVSGYGTTERAARAKLLHYVNVQEKKREECRDPKFTDNMFCAGIEGGDSCKGDSGGPVFVPMLGFGKPDDPYRLKGIVSWGPDCLTKEYKGYYTKVQNYLDWIKETIEKDGEGQEVRK